MYAQIKSNGHEMTEMWQQRSEKETARLTDRDRDRDADRQLKRATGIISKQ